VLSVLAPTRISASRAAAAVNIHKAVIVDVAEDDGPTDARSLELPVLHIHPTRAVEVDVRPSLKSSKDTVWFPPRLSCCLALGL
jgi:hypothetical protein